MAGIANYVQGPPAREYINGGESNFFARPALQLGNERTVDDITDQVEGVFNVKKDNFQPKVDKKVSYLLMAASVALVAFGIIAATVLAATGIGAAVIAAGLAIGLVAYYLHDKASAKEAQMPQVELVAKDATRRRVEKAIQRAQDEVENGGVQQGRRPAGRGHRPAFVPPRQEAPAAIAGNDW